MKKLFSLVLCLLIAVTGFAVAETYTSSSNGNNGPVTVEVSIEDGKIIAVNVLAHQETAGICDAAIATIPQKIVDAQSIAVDAVSGATNSSNAILEAVANCISDAGLNVDDFSGVVVKEAGETEEMECDVLVIGGGGAGMAAAIEANRAGASVIILERVGFLGGDTGRAGGGIEAAGTRFQEAAGIMGDTPEAQHEFIKSRGISYRDEDLLWTMVNNAEAAVEFLADLGSDFSAAPVAGHGSPVGRAHRAPEGSAGQNIVKPMIAEIERLGIPVLLNTPGKQLLVEDGKVVGAVAENLEDGHKTIVHAKAVVIATGNFATNNEMVALFDYRLKGMDTNSSAGSLGEGIWMATAVGADLENMNIFRVATAFPKGSNFIAISQDGTRFMDETHTDDTIFRDGDNAHIVVNQYRDEKHYFCVFDSNEYAASAAAYDTYIENGNGAGFDTIEELAAWMSVDPAVLSASIEKWKSEVGKTDEEFGRDMSGVAAIESAPFYAVKVIPKVHTCAGGLRINSAAEVQNTQGASIPGLYAAGEVCGGVHDGVSAVECAIVYGRIAGQSAGAAIK